ncbi:hypothetical protein BU23DRAFT_507917 [Bimuria novae-zelandiae CBS 107.79]|uniref:SP-RING-type domain-containing protein n=1 Tax=Bimuria novae-zelandiae CBS 107.79 TaxID=1447943 RepID=A0A6A5V8M6_9PLEO|nr:hypothetical protein BU23DRAFT_507917 [Bimuria novae-zelandiae CBS 107.79]
MTSRPRHSMARPAAMMATPGPSNRPAASHELPPYKKPRHALSPAAQAKLSALNDRSAEHLKKHSQKAGDRIMEAAALVLDDLYARREAVEKQSKKLQKGIEVKNHEEDKQRLAILEEKAEDYAKELEVAMRAVVDTGAAAERIEESLNWLRDHAPGQLERDYATQRSQLQSQRASQSQRRRTHNEDEDMEGGQQTQESVGPTPGPTPLDGSRPSLTGASELYAARIKRRKNEYTSKSFSARYSQNEAYRNFKKMVHDAIYRDKHPLPHPDTWFTDTGLPAPGVPGHGQDGDEDDDIVMGPATISTKCPLTLLELQDPYTSSKCPHTFERTAIFEMIRKSKHGPGGVPMPRNEEKAIKCPQSGCDKWLARNDLHHDPVLVRKIKRIQQQKQSQEDDDDDDDEESEVSVSG